MFRRGSSVVERRTENPCVGSSILPPGTGFPPTPLGTVAQRLEQAAHNRLVDGSNPSSPTGTFENQIRGYRIAAIM